LTANTPKKGFALLITITLLAFLVLLLVSLSSFSRVETQVADNNQKLSQAQQNAMAGLNIAIGQLQRHAGPDLRMTAASEITSPTRNNAFAGVWTPPAAGGTPALTTWLVNGNEGSNPLTVTPASAPDPTTAAGSDEVFLVDSNSVSTPAERVKLAKTALAVASSSVPGAGASGTVGVGHYAYWVGDQGVKASTALYDQSSDLLYDNSVGTVTAATPAAGDDWSTDNDKRDRLRQLAQPRPRTEKLFAGFDPDAMPTRTNLQRMVTSAQLPFANAVVTQANLKTQFHHVTALSEAVLVDLSSGNGRLRQDFSDTPDLTGAAEAPMAAFLRTRPASVTGWQATYSPQPAADATATAFPLFSTGPVLSEFAVQFEFQRDTTGVLQVRYKVNAELWNPYAASLDSGAGAGAAAGLSLRITGLPVVTTSSGATIDLNTLLPDPLPVPANTVWQPGQVLVLWGGETLAVAAPATPAGSSVPVAQGAAGVGTTLSAPSASGLQVELLTAGSPAPQVVATYRPGITFNPVSAVSVPDDPDTLTLGYAYEFIDDLNDWTDGSRATANDPRKTRMDAATRAFVETTASSWSQDPLSNDAAFNLAGGSFNTLEPLVLFDLPRQEVVSLGALQHVAGDKPYALGNPWGGADNTLFDRAYFSTLPRWLTTMPWDPLNPPLLPNRHLRLHIPADTATPAVGDPNGAGGTTADYLLDRTHAAKYLMQRGAFNINSTSVAAWRAVLGGVQIAGWNYNPGAPVTAALDNAFFRLPNGAQELASDPEANTPADQYTRGARTLTDGEVSQLAAAVVAALKTRGRPYPTLAAFVNDGVITNAIAAVPSINTGLTAYAPGWLSQADVLTSIAPFITPRSDTFLIRAYGDVQNPATGAIDGRAWCEALVQRLPDLTEPVSGTLDASLDPLTPTAAKYPFGRRFKLISFRWLSPSDI
jgi:hypothetical protein